jgi:hypothetical protein
MIGFGLFCNSLLVLAWLMISGTLEHAGENLSSKILLLLLLGAFSIAIFSSGSSNIERAVACGVCALGH